MFHPKQSPKQSIARGGATFTSVVIDYLNQISDLATDISASVQGSEPGNVAQQHMLYSLSQAHRYVLATKYAIGVEDPPDDGVSITPPFQVD